MGRNATGSTGSSRVPLISESQEQGKLSAAASTSNNANSDAPASVNCTINISPQSPLGVAHDLLPGPGPVVGEERTAVLNRLALAILYGQDPEQKESLASTSSSADVSSTMVADNSKVEEASEMLLESQKLRFDPTTLEPLSQSLIRLGKFSELTKLVEGAPPGVLPRTVRWRHVALSQHLAGNDNVALDVLRKALHPNEAPNDIPSLLLAARICSKSPATADEGIGYALRISSRRDGDRWQALHVLALNQGMKARGVGVSHTESSELRQTAIASLEEVAGEAGMGWGRAVTFDLSLLLAEEGSYKMALRSVKGILEEEQSGGDTWHVDGASGECAHARWHAKRGDRWRLLALILSGQKRGREAEAVCRAAVGGGAVGGVEEQLAVLRVMGKVQLEGGPAAEALETAKWRLHMLQGAKNDSGVDKVQLTSLEEHIWEDMAEVYTALGQWGDAVACAKKAVELGPYSPEAYHAQGVVEEARGDSENAQSYYETAIAINPNFAPSKINLATQYLRRGDESAHAVSWSLLNQVMRTDSTDSRCWSQLGLANKARGRFEESAQCFLTAVSLAKAAPVSSFRDVSWSIV